ncbi:class I SAM-dependent methyltransferase [Sorangium sp. So ce426]|uniref:class I SAM-dependent methyltransferase n=1 Tax=Sorangium sp. So ce426 TaxID=3133312 RepID=UPI003F5AF36A
MLPRILEPEAMDTEEDAAEYATISNDVVNEAFARRAVELAPAQGRLIDIGTGPGDIAIRIAELSSLDVTAIDLAEAMLAIARRRAGASPARHRIHVARGDAKATGFPERAFDAVVSNSLAHHLADPTILFAEAQRVGRRGAAILIKDLLRPTTLRDLDALVERYAGGDTAYQRALFRNSLHAALTLDEVRACCRSAGLAEVDIAQVSDRHWVVERASSPERIQSRARPRLVRPPE